MLGTQLTKNVLCFSFRIPVLLCVQKTGVKFILRKFNSLNILVHYFSNICFNVIFPDVRRFSSRFFHCYGCAAHSSHTFMCAPCLRQPFLLSKTEIFSESRLCFMALIGYQDYMFRPNSWHHQVPYTHINEVSVLLHTIRFSLI